jgi:ABC-type branched-subunit amino acid transport system substrate-binding protein
VSDRNPVGGAQGSGAPGSSIRIGALAPLSEPGWVDAGRHLLAGLELAVDEVNRTGIDGRPLRLVVRDTAADPRRAEAAVDELAERGVVALAGEYHSVVARAAAARAHALGLPVHCSSAVLDHLTDERTDWVARLAPAQSHGWRLYADYLVSAGHTHVAVAAQESLYWASGVHILRRALAPHHGSVRELLLGDLGVDGVCARLVESGATALLLLMGYPEPAASLVRAVRADHRLDAVKIGAPAGQPELSGWSALLGDQAGAIPFLRYMPDQLTAHGQRVERALRARLGVEPSFVAFEGYDTIQVLTEQLRSRGTHAAGVAAWADVATEGTRGLIRFSREEDLNLWQWRWAPVQVVERDPSASAEFTVLSP